jgi:hypothetical protein
MLKLPISGGGDVAGTCAFVADGNRATICHRANQLAMTTMITRGIFFIQNPSVNVIVERSRWRGGNG